MFRFSLFMSDLLKAMTHKYVRRIPKGVTKTGATKYIYYYAGQEGHGQGIAHESEIVQGASFAFGEHGKTRYHAHISKIDGDKVTVRYDDGAKKGQEETMTKKQFQALVHGEHKESIKQAKEKAEKQLKDFQTGKEKGVKVKQSTLDKLETQVNKLKGITGDKIEEPSAQDTEEIKQYKDTVKKLVEIYKTLSTITLDKKKIFSSDAVDVQSASTFLNALNSDKYKDKSPQEIADAIGKIHAKNLESEDDLPRDEALFAYSLMQPESVFHRPEVTIVSSFDKADWTNRIKPALSKMGMAHHVDTLNFKGMPQGQVKYMIPISLLLKKPDALNTLKEIFSE